MRQSAQRGTRPQQKTVLSRKYSDNKYDKPDVDARIEQ